jgi:hypothetical protein
MARLATRLWLDVMPLAGARRKARWRWRSSFDALRRDRAQHHFSREELSAILPAIRAGSWRFAVESGYSGIVYRDIIEGDRLQHRPLQERGEAESLAGGLLNACIGKGSAYPLIASRKVMPCRCDDERRETVRLGRQNTAKAHAVAPRQPCAERRPHAIELGRQISLVFGIADRCEHPRFVAGDHCGSKFRLGREMIVHTRTFDPDVTGYLSKTATVKSAAPHAGLRGF